MIHRTRMPSLEQVYRLFDDPRYLESKGADHEAYSVMANRFHDFHISPEKWPKPEPFRLGRPLAPQLPVGAGGINLPQDVADLSDGLLSLGGLGLSGWLPRTAIPNSKLNAAIVGFQRLNNLKPDGLVNPDGPTIKVLNGYLPLPQAPETIARAPMYEAAVLNQSPEPLPGRDITARGLGDEALARSCAEEARYEADMEAERRADDPFGDILGGRWENPVIAQHVDKWLAEDEADVRARREADAALAGIEPRLMSMNSSQRDRIIDYTIDEFERGWSESEAKLGRPTQFGIQQVTLDRYRELNPDSGFDADVALLERPQAKQIDRELYYDEYRIGDVDDYSMARHIFDLVVLHPPGDAWTLVQEAMKKTFEESAPDLAEEYDPQLPGKELPADELVFGDTSLEALRKISERGLTDQFHNNLVELRSELMRWLAEQSDDNAKQLRGWLRRAERFRP